VKRSIVAVEGIVRMAVKLEDKPEAQCVGKRIPVGAATRWNQIREVQPHHTILEPNAQAKILQIALTGVLVVIAGAQKELVLIRVLRTQAELQTLELVLAGEGARPAAWDGVAMIGGQIGGVRGRIAGRLRRYRDEQLMHIEPDHQFVVLVENGGITRAHSEVGGDIVLVGRRVV